MSVIGFPLLLIPLAICNIIVFLMPGVLFSAPVVTVTLLSGVAWPVTLGDVLLALGIVLLLLEIIKGSRPGGKHLTDHLLSLAVFAGAAAEFAMLPQFGSSSYFLLTLLALVDFLSGLALRARRPARAAVAPAQPAPEVETAATKVRLDPPPVGPPSVSSLAPAPDVPIAAPVAESILNSAPEPVVVRPEADGARHPDVAAPDIQPGRETPQSSDQVRR
jgi:hypothetical protein